MNTNLDFRYTFITFEKVIEHVFNPNKTYIQNLNDIKKTINKIIAYNVDIIMFQYQLLEKLNKKREYKVIKQIERDIKIIEERLEIYREFDNISKL